MSEKTYTDTDLDELPFHEYCAGCNQRFDGTVLDPTVIIV